MAMHPTLGDLLLVLTVYFPDDLSLQRLFYTLAAILSLQAVVQLNRNQRRLPGQRPLTRHQTVTIVPLLGQNMQWGKGHLIVAGCRQCRAVYHVDHVMRPQSPLSSMRVQHLEYETQFLRVSKTENIWVERRVVQFQEAAIFRFKASWQGFADVLNRSFLQDSLHLRDEQSHKLFVEHFTRRLVVAHGLENIFTCAPDPSADNMTKALLGLIGRNQGIVPGSLDHVCIDCAHQKHYRSDNVQDPQLGRTPDDALAEVDDPGALGGGYTVQPLAAGFQAPAPAAAGVQVWVRMAVMDGKTLTHRICAIDRFREPLVNYRLGRFCHLHLENENVCGINTCGRPIAGEGAVTCNLPAHVAIHQAWKQRFGWASFQGVRRGIKKGGPWDPDSQPDQEDAEADLGHTFHARRTYCVQTIQWACGMRIGWGKCYEIESVSQALQLVNFWFPPEEAGPAFIVYDNACKLLAHIVTQNAHDLWLTTTRFVVDAWHYINHRSTDRLCQECQPDLVILERDGTGQMRASRAFNTEVGEQFNAWMDGFESQLRQMTDFNFDFFIHSVMILYKEEVEQRVEGKQRAIPNY
ncbi:hypothetical protein JB92DRAFT_2836847 [Gautieria morchelliformis]|nr:hypothetical protein JB92DRAFT_2836847 [Gautieria morchelliformis]